MAGTLKPCEFVLTAGCYGHLMNKDPEIRTQDPLPLFEPYQQLPVEEEKLYVSIVNELGAWGMAKGEMEPLREMGCAVYPMTEIVPNCKIDDFTEYLGGNHYALVYADVMDAMELFCKYADMEMV